MSQDFAESVVQINRVSKKTKGGNKMGFAALMVVGDKQGQVGVALGKAKDVQNAVKKGVRRAKKRLITVPMNGTTIPFPITVKWGAARIMLKPAPRGSGVIAGGPVRAVVEAAGIRDISSKIMGTSNQASNVYATFAALQEIKRIVTLKSIRLISIAEVEAQERMAEREEQRAAQGKAKEDEKAEAKVADKPKTKKVIKAKPATEKKELKKTAKSEKAEKPVKAAKIEKKSEKASEAK